jgi:hypothetical protein
MFTEIDWAKILGANDIQLVFPPIVVHELDELKISAQSRHMRERAQTVLAQLMESRTKGAFTIHETKIQVRFLVNEPMIDWQTEQLDSNINDDRLIASILCFSREQEISKKSITLFTSDVGLHLKAESRSLNTGKLGTDLAIAPTEDSIEIELHRTQKELNRLRGQLPKLSIRFSDVSGVDHKSYQIKKVNLQQPDEADIRKQANEIGERLLKPFTVGPQHTINGRTIGEVFHLIDIPIDKIEKYRNDVQYVKEYPSYVKQSSASLKRLSLSIKLELSLENCGGAPAEDSDIFLHFPDGFELTDSEPFEAVIPDPPAVPKRWNEDTLGILAGDRMMSRHFGGTQANNPISAPPNLSSLDVRKTNSYDVRLSVQKIKHHMDIPLHPMWITFHDFDSAKSFSFQYEILTANSPDPFSGELHVVMDRT